MCICVYIQVRIRQDITCTPSSCCGCQVPNPAPCFPDLAQPRAITFVQPYIWKRSWWRTQYKSPKVVERLQTWTGSQLHWSNPLLSCLSLVSTSRPLPFIFCLPCCIYFILFLLSSSLQGQILPVMTRLNLMVLISILEMADVVAMFQVQQMMWAALTTTPVYRVVHHVLMQQSVNSLRPCTGQRRKTRHRQAFSNSWQTSLIPLQKGFFLRYTTSIVTTSRIFRQRVPNLNQTSPISWQKNLSHRSRSCWWRCAKKESKHDKVGRVGATCI